MKIEEIKNATDDRLIEEFTFYMDLDHSGRGSYHLHEREMQAIDDELTRRGINVDLIVEAKIEQYTYREMRMYDYGFPPPLTVKEALALGTTKRPDLPKSNFVTIKEPYEDYGIEELDESLRDLATKELSKLIKRNTEFLKVVGDSMIGIGINEGDILITDTATQDYDSKIVAARIWKKNNLIKRFVRAQEREPGT